MMRSWWMIALLMCGAGAGPLMAEEADPADRLSGTTWNVTLRPVDATQEATVQQDTISFEGRRMRSEGLAQEGYPSSNCTIRLTADGALTWETMQTKSGEGVAFWRGELRDGQMSGALTKQPDAGPPQHFSFTTTRETEDAAPDAGLQTSGPPSPPTPRRPHKKKKWLFW